MLELKNTDSDFFLWVGSNSPNQSKNAVRLDLIRVLIFEKWNEALNYFDCDCTNCQIF